MTIRSLQLAGPVAVALLAAACSKGEALGPLPASAAALVPAPAAPRLTPLSGDGTGSTIALAALGSQRLALVADSDGRALRLLDTRTDEELPVTELAGEPASLVVAADGRVFVSLRDAAEIDVLEVVPGQQPALRVAARMATDEEPVGLSLTPDGRTLLVACGWAHTLDAFSTRTLERAFQAPVGREPRAVLASADGRRAYVSHAASSQVTVIDLMSPGHEPAPVRLEQPDSRGNGAGLAFRQGFALARAELGVLAPGVTANTGDTTVRSETYGGTDSTSGPAEAFSVAVLDGPPGPGASAPQPLRVVDDAVTGCLLPRAAAYDEDGEWLLVACQGTDQVWRVDARAHRAGVAAAGPWKVGAEPTGLALDRASRVAFVWSQQGRTVAEFPIDEFRAMGDDRPALRSVALGPRVEALAPLALGRALFHASGDPRISSDGRACASCHPEGRDDGLVWATPEGPRQTPTLAGRLVGTAPYGWTGAAPSAKKHVQGTLRRLGGTGLDDASMDALIAYCMAMKGPPRAAVRGAAPASAPAEGLDLVAEGRDLFDSEAAGCSTCHMVDGTFTDGSRHDVHSRAKGDPKRRFDTPSLRSLAGTAPYFHDGRYPTLRALLLGTDGTMGHTAQLSGRELDALESYLRTL